MTTIPKTTSRRASSVRRTKGGPGSHIDQRLALSSDQNARREWLTAASNPGHSTKQTDLVGPHAFDASKTREGDPATRIV